MHSCCGSAVAGDLFVGELEPVLGDGSGRSAHALYVGHVAQLERLEHEVSRGQQRSVEVSRGQQRSAEVSRGQQRSVEVSRE